MSDPSIHAVGACVRHLCSNTHHLISETCPETQTQTHNKKKHERTSSSRNGSASRTIIMMLKETSLTFVAACMLSSAPLGKVAAQTDVVEEFDCDAYLATTPVKTTANIDEDQPYLTLDTNEVKTWRNLGTSITEKYTCSE